MIATVKKSTPLFCQGQQVRFIGGAGIVKSFFPNAGSWFYQVEMEMGPVPAMGRIGYETTVLLSEVDMTDETNCPLGNWAIAGM